jgi:hypothetical protein
LWRTYYRRIFNVEDNNCFARKGVECTALNLCVCYGRCSFYKTTEVFENGLRAAFARIDRLPYWQQYMIAERYYGGAFPWRSADSAGRYL